MNKPWSRARPAFGYRPPKPSNRIGKQIASNFLGALAALVCFASTASPQCRTTVSGTVTDEQGVPLPGATVLIHGTLIGARTDGAGRYVIVVPAESADGRPAVLVGRVIGYAARKIPILLAQGSTIHQNFALVVNPPQLEFFSRRGPVM